MRLIIDTDAGVDDAEALLLALTSKDVFMEAITTVTGNVHVSQVNKNICTVLQATQKQIPVYSGAINPLVEPWIPEDEPYHLADGLGEWDERPPCDMHLEDEHAANALVRMANENPGELTLVALGPLTNVALAIRLDPEFPSKLKQFVFMGGAFHARGNTDIVTAEFNIRMDPEAAFITLGAFPHATMVSWETTFDNVLSWEQYDELCDIDTPLGRFYRGITIKTATRSRNKEKWDGHLLPDPLAMAVTLHSELIIDSEIRHVTIELAGKHTRGQTVVNYTDNHTGEPNVNIVKRVDMNGVFELYQQALARA